MGAVWSVAQVTKRLDLKKALGTGWPGRLALWQVLTRHIEPGSRLSAARLEQTHAAGDLATPAPNTGSPLAVGPAV